jgi:hypothetical protein
MSALGQKPTYALQQAMSALPPIATAKADFRKGHVCFTPESGHVQCTHPCPLWAKSGHSFVRVAGLVEYLNFPASHVVGYVVLDCNGVPGANCFLSDR